MSSLHWTKALQWIAWPAIVLSTAMVSAGVLSTEGPTNVARRTHYTVIEKVRTVGTARKTSGISTTLINAALFGAVFVMLDECAGLDILYTTFGIDILPKTKLQKMLRTHRGMWREAKASGCSVKIRETFFLLKRERFDLTKVKYQEERMRTPWDTGRPCELLDPQDVRVFFILSKGSNSVVGKVYIAFNTDLNEPGVREKVDRTTKWILTGQVEPRQATGGLEMPYRLERAYRDRSEGEHLVHWGWNGDGSHTLADAWDCRRTIFVAGDGMGSAK